MQVKGSAPLLPFCRSNPDESDDGGWCDDDDDEEEDEEEEEEPDEDFLLEGASSTLICPISLKLMTSAVLAMDTHCCQKEALEEWVERRRSEGKLLTSSMTSAPMEAQMIVTQTVRVLVQEHIEARQQAWRRMQAEKKKRGGDGGGGNGGR